MMYHPHSLQAYAAADKEHLPEKLKEVCDASIRFLKNSG